jgi:septal ring factor EnvC (AmiA/AmiB activator)
LSVPARAGTTDDDIDRTRAAIADVAQRWFDSQAQAATLDAQIAELEQQVADARAEADAAGEIAAAQAVELYRTGSTSGLAPVLDTSDALETARRAELLSRADDEAHRAIDELNAAAADLETRQHELEQQRDEQAKVTEDLLAQQAELDAQLDALESKAAKEAEAARAAAARRAAQSRPTRVAAPTNPAPATAIAAAPIADVAPAPTGAVHPRHDEPFLVCTRERESAGDYTAVNPSGYYGAYQFHPTTWDVTASRAGRMDLVGVLPSRAGAYDQDELAWVLYQWQGNRPWNGRC